MKPPETAQEWWNNVRASWDDLMSILNHHLDFGSPAYFEPGSDTSLPTRRTVYEELTHLRDQEDERLARYLFAAWNSASESHCHSVPSWGVLRDLLSEEWCIIPDHPNNQKEPFMITPTVGRIVYYYEKAGFPENAAIVTRVHSDRCVNLRVFDEAAEAKPAISVTLVQPGDDCPVGQDFCEWMPYQVRKQTGSESGEAQAGTQGI